VTKKTNLIVEIGGKVGKSFTNSVKATQRSVSSLSKNISREMNNAAAASAKGFKNVLRNDAFQAAAVGAAALGAGIMGSVKAAVEFESAMSDVKKVVNFDTPKGFTNLQKDIRALAREIPITAAGFAEIVASAGQAGVANNELTRFAESAAKMGVAFDISAGEAGDAMAKFRTAMKLDQDQVEALADSINHLSNNFAATAGETTNFMMRVGALKGQMAISEQSIAAFGTAMIGAGAAPEVAATSFRNLTKALMKGDAATKAQMGAFSQLGLSSGQLAKDMQRDAEGTILDVFARLSKAPAELRNSLSTQLFGSEARALTPLLTNTENLKKALDSVASTDLFSGSMQAEFAERSKTAANAQIIFKNNLNDLGIAIGSVLLPALTDLMKGLAPIIAGFANFADANPGLTKALVVLTAGFVGLVAVAPFVASLISVIGSIKLALAGLAGAKLFAGIGLQIKTLLIIGKVAIGVLAGGLKSLFALMLANPIGLLVAAIVGIGVGLVVAYNKCEWFREGVNSIVSSIAGFFVGLWDKIVAGFDAVVQAVQPIFNAWVQTISGVVQTIKGIFQTLWGIFTGDSQMAVDGVSNIFGGLKNVFGGIVDGIRASWDLVSGIVQSVATNIVTTLTALPGQLVEIGGSIISGFGAIWTQLSTIVEGVAAGIVATFVALPMQLINVGGAIIDTIKEGFISRFGALKDTIVKSFTELRKLLPFSDAKKGPFKDLTASGRAIVTTLAQGVKDRESVLRNAIGDTAALAMEGMGPTFAPIQPAFAMPSGGSFAAPMTAPRAAPQAAPKRSRGNDGNGVFGFLNKILPVAAALIPGGSKFQGIAQSGLNIGEELIHGGGLGGINPMQAAATLAPVVNVSVGGSDASAEEIARVVTTQLEQVLADAEADQRASLND